MEQSSSPVTLDFYRRRDCAVCDEARDSLQQVLEDRVRRGDPVPRVQYVDVDADPRLSRSHGPRVPVIALGEHELSLVSGYRPISLFLDRVLGRAA
jgi:hypothetical protein